MTNNLQNEKSPYLKQHKNNPVDWFAWNKKTLDIAKDKKRPIFLSVGYASCNWCHVMAHESFEDDQTAKIMNENFINIKVDREERPDLDYVFQRSLSILTGTQGGWPLSMFLDENAVPFTGGTYFPPKEMHGRPDFRKVLLNVSEVYKKNREKIISQAPQMMDIFSKINQRSAVLDQSLEPFVDKIIYHLDEINGSFKGAPKFPQFYLFDAMFYFYLKTKNEKYFKPVEVLLSNLCSKGIYDQLGGGISRYAVDQEWIIPHFEKMLYDNIQFIGLLAKFYIVTKNNYFKEKLYKTINFINKEFINDSMLYGSAYDADSEGVEGKFYVWSLNELKEILKENINLFSKKYLVSEKGNFEGKNILVEIDSSLSDDKKLKIRELENKLLKERGKRKKPLFDDKSQTDQNAFLIDTLLNISTVLEDEELKNQTLNKFKIFESKISNKIIHCYENSEIDVFLEDYVYCAKLMLTLYEIESDESYLAKSSKILDETWLKFYENKSKLLQKNIVNENDLFVNPIDLNDNNIPNGNSTFLEVCNKLYLITNDKKWYEKSEILKKSFHQVLNSNFAQMFSFIKTLDAINDCITFTFFGKLKLISNLKDFVHKEYLGRATFIYKKYEETDAGVVICKNQTCSNKLTTVNEIQNYLKENRIN